jgi:D-beta-D-heptose 7-phosphate kinase/D-beta-D-heptose 1-phosphate adenosyltransferase
MLATKMPLSFDDMPLDSKMLDQIARGRVVIIGDVILDVYVDGEVARISPEAPVPILHVRSERYVPGGAANVAANVAALGGEAKLIGVIGADANASRLAMELAELEKLTLSLVVSDTRPTATKTRYLGGVQQILRVDREQATPLSAPLREKLLKALDTALTADVGALILSDYAKGTFAEGFAAEVIARGRAAGVPVLVDPKARDLTVYAGATVITPNRKELQEATDLPCLSDADVVTACAKAVAATGADILLTRSELGMSYVGFQGDPVHMPTEAREVFDVSGAGDTVVAAFGLSVSAGLGVPQAMRIANLAAGVVVAKHGTAMVTAAELAAKLRRNRLIHDPFEVFENADALAERCANWRREGLTIGFANGCFDLIHPGHIRLIHGAAQTCDRLVIALNSDASVRRLKGPSRPLQNEASRAEVMSAIKGVDAVTFFAEDTPIALIRKLMPDVIIKGSDYTEEQVVGGDFVKGHGGRVVLIDLKEGHSTTQLARKARKV